MLRAPSVVPKYAEVANAVGAVAGRIRIERTLVITQPSADTYRVHTANDPPDFRDLEAAKDFAFNTLREGVITEAEAAGAVEIESRRRKSAGHWRTDHVCGGFGDGSGDGASTLFLERKMPCFGANKKAAINTAIITTTMVGAGAESM